MDQHYAQYLLKKTKENYNKIAFDFSRVRRNIWEEYKFLFDCYLKKGEKVLDLGCAHGRFFEIFKEKKVDYIGVDFSAELIKIAKKKYPEGKFFLADAFHLPFPKEYFDKIYAIAIFHHIPSTALRVKFLKEIKRVLKKDGFLILTVWKIKGKRIISLILKTFVLKIIGKSKLDFRDAFIGWGGKKGIKRYYHFFSKREIRNLTKKAGLKIFKIGIIQNEIKKRSNIYLIAQKS